MHSTNHRELQVCAVTMDMDRDGWRLPFLFFFLREVFFFRLPFLPFLPLFLVITIWFVFLFLFFFFPLSSSEGLGLWGRRRLVDDSTIVRRHGNPESSFFEEQIREKSEK